MNAPGAFIAPVAERDFAPSVGATAACKVDLVEAASLLTDNSLANQWDALSANASEPNPFAERWYLKAALGSLGGADNVRVVLVSDGLGIVGMLPLQRQTRYGGLPVAHLQNWINHNAFLGTPLVRQGAEQAFWNALLAQLDQPDGGVLFLHLTAMATEGKVTAALLDACKVKGRRIALVQHEERALLERGLSPDAYLEAHVRGKKRKELRRQHKRLSEEGALSFRRSDGREGLDQWIDDFLALEMRGWKGTNASALACASETRLLFHDALHGAAAAGKLELLDLSLDGRPIAMLVNFLTAPGAFSFKTAFDEDYARFSPGVLLQVENLALLEREAIDWCDSCAAQDHPMIDSLWAGRRRIGRYSIAIGGNARRAAFAVLLAAEKAKARLRGRIIA